MMLDHFAEVAIIVFPTIRCCLGFYKINWKVYITHTTSETSGLRTTQRIKVSFREQLGFLKGFP